MRSLTVLAASLLAQVSKATVEWKCLDKSFNFESPVAVDENGDIQCWSNSGYDCYAAPGGGGCASTIAMGAPMKKMVCGCDIMSKFGNPGYDQGPNSVCNFAQAPLNAHPPTPNCPTKAPAKATCDFEHNDVITIQSHIAGTYLIRDPAGKLVGDQFQPIFHPSYGFQPPPTEWTVVDVSNGRFAFKSDLGTFLSKDPARANAFLVGGTDATSLNVQFRCQPLAGDLFALLTTTDHVLSRVDLYTDTLVTTDTVDVTNVLAQFKATIVQKNPCNFKDGDSFAMQGDTGKFVGAYAGYINDPKVAWDAVLYPEAGGGAPRWTVENVPNSDRKLAFKNENGAYLGRCTDCAGGATSPHEAFAMSVEDVHKSPQVQWTCEPAGVGGQIALKSDVNLYLSRCVGCVPLKAGKTADALVLKETYWRNWLRTAQFSLVREFVPVWKCLEDADATLGPWANSPMSLDANGDVQCWSNNGRECYVPPEGCKATITSGAKPLSKMVCGCDILSKFGNTGYDQGPRSFCNFAQKALNASPPNLPCTPPSAVCTFKDGDVVGLQADTGEFVGRCNGCLRKPRTTWDVILLGPLSYSTKWTVRNIPHTGRITLVLDTGAYLGRCHGCAGGATLPDQAFAVPPSGINYLVDPNVQWACEEAGPDNRIALKGDMGTYLSRCHGCVPIIGGVPDAMFMHARDWRSNGPAQFTLHRLPSTPPMMLAVKSSHDNSVESVNEASVAGTVMIVAGCVGVVVAAMTTHRRRRVRRQGFVRV